MDNPNGDRRENRRPWLIAATLVGVGAALMGVALATGTLRLNRSTDSTPSAERLAQQRCEADILKRLVTPEKATISDVHVENSTLDDQGRDFSSLTASEPLKGVDRSRISVLNVAGVANSPSEVGSTISDRFDCRAYFIDGKLAHTLVVFDHGH